MAHVTAIIPNYNHERFLARRIETVLGQTHRDLDVIFLDDASTDASLDVFARYASDPRVRMRSGRANSGSPFAQWNEGVREATGEYVWIAESDDYADPALLEALVAVLDAHPNVGLAYCDSWLVDEHDRVTGSFFEQPDVREWVDTRRWHQDFVRSGREECLTSLAVLNTIPNASAVLFRRSLYQEAGGADESFRMAGDWVLWADLLSRADVGFVARHLNYWRQHPGTVRQRLFDSGSDVEEAFRATLRMRTRLGIPHEYLEKPRAKLASFWFWRTWERWPNVSLGHMLRVHRYARELDPHLARRFVRTLGRKLARRLRSRAGRR